MKEKTSSDSFNSYGMSDKDYQPGMDEFAGKMAGRTNEYMERTDKLMTSQAKKIKSEAYKGRYE